MFSAEPVLRRIRCAWSVRQVAGNSRPSRTSIIRSAATPWNWRSRSVSWGLRERRSPLSLSSSTTCRWRVTSTSSISPEMRRLTPDSTTSTTRTACRPVLPAESTSMMRTRSARRSCCQEKIRQASCSRPAMTSWGLMSAPITYSTVPPHTLSPSTASRAPSHPRRPISRCIPVRLRTSTTTTSCTWVPRLALLPATICWSCPMSNAMRRT